MEFRFFLAVGGDGLEHRELFGLIGTLIKAPFPGEGCRAITLDLCLRRAEQVAAALVNCTPF
ncbi:hypothetical protein [Methylobacterium nigriterrae]|uniref:hypothetical protein n=1 Tax=Methylobacterium nigriterrae TaxID=3127512 RepID=UPI0030138F79